MVEQLKQKDVTELLARADDLAVQNTSYQEVYSAMAKSLAEAWKDLNEQLEYRKMLLDQSIAFHESALQVSRLIDHRVIDWLIDWLSCSWESRSQTYVDFFFMAQVMLLSLIYDRSPHSMLIYY